MDPGPDLALVSGNPPWRLGYSPPDLVAFFLSPPASFSDNQRMSRLAIFLCTFLSFLSQSFALHVLLDPGHGGVDQGAVHGRLKEAEVVLDIAQRLERLLKSEPGLQVSMTREDNTHVALAERTRQAERLRADLLVSLHANAAPDARARGVELFFQNSLPPDENALYLANLENQLVSDEGSDENASGDVAAILEDLKRQDRLKSSLHLSKTMSRHWQSSSTNKERVSIKQAPLFVVSRAKVPSVLVEVGFLTNPQEARQLASPAHRQRLAESLRDALIDYKATLARPIQNETVSK